MDRPVYTTITPDYGPTPPPVLQGPEGYINEQTSDLMVLLFCALSCAFLYAFVRSLQKKESPKPPRNRLSQSLENDGIELPELPAQHAEQGFDDGMPEVDEGAQASDGAEEGGRLLDGFEEMT